jgi:hypothetical protein
MLATIAAFRDPWEAHMFRLRLEAEDVPAVVAYEFHIGNNWLWSTALGGVRVQVPNDFAEAAFDVKSLCRTGKYRADLIEEFGDIDDPHCPHCGSQNYWKRRPLSVMIFSPSFYRSAASRRGVGSVSAETAERNSNCCSSNARATSAAKRRRLRRIEGP